MIPLGFSYYYLYENTMLKLYCEVRIVNSRGLFVNNTLDTIKPLNPLYLMALFTGVTLLY